MRVDISFKLVGHRAGNQEKLDGLIVKSDWNHRFDIQLKNHRQKSRKYYRLSLMH